MIKQLNEINPIASISVETYYSDGVERMNRCWRVGFVAFVNMYKQFATSYTQKRNHNFLSNEKSS